MTRKLNPSTAKGSSARSKRVPVAAPALSEETLERLARANRKARERATAVRHGFVGSDPQVPDRVDEAPLALLLRGTRGGAVRLKFYLALLWQAGGGDDRHIA